MSVMTKIKEIEDEMGRTQKNKATMGHLCMLKASIQALMSLSLSVSLCHVSVSVSTFNQHSSIAG